MNYIMGVAIAGIVLYNSVYFRSLDEKLAEGQEVVFDATALVEGIWSTELLTVYDSATDISVLLDQLRQHPARAFENQAKALGIGNIGYFKVKGEGSVIRVNENNVLVQIGSQAIEIETEFIFGNAVRDASGLIQLNDYDKTADFNSISEAINDKIRKEVIPVFRERVSVGDKVRFKAALELNKAHLDMHQPEIIPVSLQLIP